MLEKLKEIFNNFNSREKTLLITGIFVLLGIGVYTLFEPLGKSFQNVEKEYKDARNELALLPNQLERYLTLHKRKDQIELEFQKVEAREGVLSHIEKLISEKGGVTQTTDYKINDLAKRNFGTSYIQEPFKIELYMTSEEKLAKFLKSLVSGKRPLVVTRMDIKKAPNNSKLIVQIDVSNFRKKNDEALDS